MSRLAAGALLAGAVVAVAPAVAVAQGGCDQQLEELDPIDDTPWAEQWFALERLSPRPRAGGVTVAVIDTGVEDDHEQLNDGQVLTGRDLVEEPGPDGRTDCHGHGTGVASIIAASEAEGVAFAGLAPGAEILPFRVTERDTESSRSEDGPPPIPPAPVAQAIRQATDEGAQIINVSLAFYGDFEEIREAVRYALDRDVIVVAAAGNVKGENGEPDPPAYPAFYDGVVSVGAIARDGSRFAETYVGPGVDLLAPGAEVTTAYPGGGHALNSGTSFAAPFVSAAAALVLAGNPDLSGPEVVERLIATADPGPGSATSYAPVVNPYRALTGRVADGDPVAIPPPSEPPPDPAAVARAERWERNTQRAVIIMVIAISLTVIGFIGATIWRRGEQHGWRPGQRHDPVFPHPVVDEPEREFFTVPTPRQRR
jgi:membrane-anchored mycosin MYCP